MREHLQMKHWSSEDLLDHLYGLETAGKDFSHVEACAECGSAWRELLEKKNQILARELALDDGKLRKQREAIWSRIERVERPWIWRAVPAAASVLLLTIAISLQQGPDPVPPAREMAVSQQPVSDEQFFTEIASVANEVLPSSTDPVMQLFDTRVEGDAQ